MVDDARLAALNGALRKKPHRGVIVVCPYLPDRFRSDGLYEDAARYGDFLVGTVLPRVYAETPAIGTAATTGIDGVSLGGRAAVVVGLTHPNAFGAVGGIQAAFGMAQVEKIAALAKSARAKAPKLALSLVSSDADRFLEVTKALSAALTRDGVAHRLLIAEGEHGREFNRGPGVYEMLVYYDRILRGEDTP
jgi:iron(III)-salmochelin esterase